MVSICFLVASLTVTATDVSFGHESVTTMPDEIVTYSVVTSTNWYTISPVEMVVEHQVVDCPKFPEHWKWLQKHHTQQAKLQSRHQSPAYWMRTRAQLCLDHRALSSLQLILMFIMVIL